MSFASMRQRGKALREQNSGDENDRIPGIRISTADGSLGIHILLRVNQSLAMVASEVYLASFYDNCRILASLRCSGPFSALHR